MAKISKKNPLGRGLSSLLGENLNVDNLTNLNTKLRPSEITPEIYYKITELYEKK